MEEREDSEEGERKMKDIVTKHELTARRVQELQEKEREWKTKEEKFKEENKKLLSNLEDIELESTRAEKEKRSLEEEINRINIALQKNKMKFR